MNNQPLQIGLLGIENVYHQNGIVVIPVDFNVAGLAPLFFYWMDDNVPVLETQNFLPFFKYRSISFGSKFSISDSSVPVKVFRLISALRRPLL